MQSLKDQLFAKSIKIMMSSQSNLIHGLHRDMMLDKVWFFGLHVHVDVLSRVRTCPKQGMVTQSVQDQIRDVNRSLQGHQLISDHFQGTSNAIGVCML